MDDTYPESPGVAPHPVAIRLHRNLRRVCDAGLAYAIAFAASLPETASRAEKAEWVLRVTAELERCLPAATVRSVMLGCHRDDMCRLGEMKAWLGGLYRESASLEEFVDRVNEHGAGWRIEDGAIYTKFLWCECHMLREVETLPSMTWCHCTEGYTRALFEHVLDCEVESELLQTIKTGHDCCIVKITPKEGLKGWW